MTDAVIKEAALEQSFDNLTVVILSFKSLETYYNTRPEAQHLFQIKEAST
jgi:hypothetical protein